MAELYPRKWEVISNGVARLKVPGGWLVTTWEEGIETLCYVPDERHQWELEPEEEKGDAN